MSKVRGPVNEYYRIDPFGLFLAVEMKQYKWGFELRSIHFSPSTALLHSLQAQPFDSTDTL